MKPERKTQTSHYKNFTLKKTHLNTALGHTDLDFKIVKLLLKNLQAGGIIPLVLTVFLKQHNRNITKNVTSKRAQLIYRFARIISWYWPVANILLLGLSLFIRHSDIRSNVGSEVHIRAVITCLKCRLQSLCKRIRLFQVASLIIQQRAR